MENIFLQILNMSITASWLILAVILLRVLLKKAPKFIRCILWGLVGIRLILPFSFESILSLIPSANTIPREILYIDEPAINSGFSAVDNAVNPVISNGLEAEIVSGTNVIEIITYIASVVWIIGIVGMLIYSVISYARLHRRVSASINIRDNVYYCDDISTPFILGINKPKIYLPSGITENQSEYVIAHENAHIKRRDHWWKPFGFILLSVYWFNPLIWIAYVLLCRDIEMVCDEKVIKNMDKEYKAEYSETLVKCSTQQRRMIMACPLSFGEVGVKDRIKSILSYKKPALWIIIVAIIACIGVTIAFMTNPIVEDFSNSNAENIVTEIDVSNINTTLLTNIDNSGFYKFENDKQSVIMLKKSANRAYKSYCEVVGNFIHIYYNSVEGKTESNTICNTAYLIDNKYTNDDTTIIVYLDGKISKFKEVIVTDNEILTNCKTENSNSNNGDIMLGKESNMFGRESISERHRRLNNASYNLENCYETIDNNDETYNYIIKNKNGDILKEFKNVWPPFSIVEVNKRTLKSDYSHGTGYCATSTQYYDVNDSRISEEFFGVIGEYQDKVLYADSQNSEYYLVVQDIYDKEKFYKKILLKDCPVAADPVTSLEISKNEAIITYLKGNSYRETQEVFIAIDLTNTDNSFDILKMLETERFSFKEDYAQYKNEVGVKTDNFKNITTNDIYFEEDALALAKNEITISYNQTKIFYDYEEEYWKVCFYTEDMLGGAQTVYLDSDGKTVMCVYGE